MATSRVSSNPKRRAHDRGPGVVDLLEDGYSLVRRAPLSLWAGYCIGAVPFVVVFVYFWADMSRGFHADQRCAAFALALALLFVWMGVWQSWTAAAFKALAAETDPPRVTFPRFLNAWLLCCVLQPVFLVVTPIAALMAAPFAWTVMFFPTAGMLCWEENDWSSLFAEGRRIAGLWPLRSNALVAVLTLLAASVFLDIAVILWVLPYVFKFFTGIETVFTRSGPWYVTSTTFLAVAVSATYLVVKPFALAATAVRCFYAQARTTGVDLRLRFRRAITPARAVLTAILVAMTADNAVPGAPAAEKTNPSVMDAHTFNQAVERVLSRPEFAWRLPRLRSPDPQSAPGFVVRFAREVNRILGSWRKKIAQWLEKPVRRLDRWLEKVLNRRSDRRSERMEGRPVWPAVLRGVAWSLIIIGTIVALVMYLRARKRRAAEAQIEAMPATTEPEPDLDAPYVPPEDLPYLRWLERARDLAGQGAYRHALRAVYLASLALLTDRKMIAPAPYKSNGEYRREVNRHAHAVPGLESVFTEMARLFECVWYGTHPADELRFEQALKALQRMEAAFAER